MGPSWTDPRTGEIVNASVYAVSYTHLDVYKRQLQVFDPSLRIMKNNIMGSDPNTLPEFYVRGQSGIGVKELDREVSQTSLQNNPNAPDVYKRQVSFCAESG